MVTDKLVPLSAVLALVDAKIAEFEFMKKHEESGRGMSSDKKISKSFAIACGNAITALQDFRDSIVGLDGQTKKEVG